MRLVFVLALVVTIAVPLFPDEAEMSLSDRFVTVLFWGMLAAFRSWCGRVVHLVFYFLATATVLVLIYGASEWLADPQLASDPDFVGGLASAGIPGALSAVTWGVARRLDTQAAAG